MTIQCTAHHGFRYCAEAADEAQMKDSVSHHEKWKRILTILMITIFLVILFILL